MLASGRVDSTAAAIHNFLRHSPIYGIVHIDIDWIGLDKKWYDTSLIIVTLRIYLFYVLTARDRPTSHTNNI